MNDKKKYSSDWINKLESKEHWLSYWHQIKLMLESLQPKDSIIELGTIGILCFSGSLYALALTGIKWFGPITPLGGLTFMLGWGLFVYAALQVKEVNQ